MANALKFYIFSAARKYGPAAKIVQNFKNKYSNQNMNRQPTKENQYAGMVYIDGKPAKDIFIGVANTDIIVMSDKQGRFFIDNVKDLKQLICMNPEKVHANGTITVKDFKGKQYGINFN